MKKLLISGLALIAFVLPSLAQDHDYNSKDKEAVVTGKLTKDQVPAAVLKAASTQFNLGNSETWSRFPYAIKEYAFVYDQDAADIKLNHYHVTFKTKEGNDFSAIYSSEGELISTREITNNAPIPASVIESLGNSKYKDWKIVGSKEIIRFYHDHDKKNVEQHFRVTVEKDNVKRNLSFNYQATANK